jgi:hypothetical protein
MRIYATISKGHRYKYKKAINKFFDKACHFAKDLKFEINFFRKAFKFKSGQPMLLVT